MSAEKPNFLSQPVVKNIFMYRNGDPYYEARRLVINQKRVSNFETLLREVTGGVQAPFGAVRNIYTPRAGHRVESLEHLQSGEQYVAAGRERFKKLDYLQIGSRKKRMMQTLPMQAKPVPQSRIIVSARFLKPIKEPFPIFVVANGDVLNPAMRLLITQRMLGQFDKILEMITEKMSLRILGGARSLYTFEGHHVAEGKQLESGQFYVAVGRDKFKRLPYNDLLFTKPRGMRRVNGVKASSLPPIYRLSKQNGNNKSTVRSSEGGAESKASPPAPSVSNKDQLSSIVREISQARLISLRKKRSGQSMTLEVPDNDDVESKAEDGETGNKSTQDQPAAEKPTSDNDTENAEKAGEKEEASAAENNTKEDTSSNKEEKENPEPKQEAEGGATADAAPVNGEEEEGNKEEEEVKEEVKEEVSEEVKEEIKEEIKEEPGTRNEKNTDKNQDNEGQAENTDKNQDNEGQAENTDKNQDNEGQAENADKNQDNEGQAENTDKNQDNEGQAEDGNHSVPSNDGKEDEDKDSVKGEKDKSSGEVANGIDAKEEEKETENDEARTQSDSKVKEARSNSSSSSSSSSDSNQEEDKAKTKESPAEGPGGEEREMNGERDGDRAEESDKEDEEKASSSKDAKADGEKEEEEEKKTDEKSGKEKKMERETNDRGKGSIENKKS